MSRLALVAVLGALLGSWAAPARADEPDAPLQLTATLQPEATLFGDPVTADVEVEFDPGKVDASSIRVLPSFVPYSSTSAPVVQRLGSGSMRFRYTLLCVTDDCLPGKRPRVLRLAPVEVTALEDGRSVKASAPWPALRVASRLAASDRSGPIEFRTPDGPPSPAYRARPGLLAAGLIAAAALSALAAVAFAARGLARRSSRAPASRLSPLALAIAYVRDSARRTESDRRRALGALAEAVDDLGEPRLADSAAETAWSERPPTPAGAAELADRAAAAGRDRR
jgi:hypothetical protein